MDIGGSQILGIVAAWGRTNRATGSWAYSTLSLLWQFYLDRQSDWVRLIFRTGGVIGLLTDQRSSSLPLRFLAEMTTCGQRTQSSHSMRGHREVTLEGCFLDLEWETAGFEIGYADRDKEFSRRYS